MVLYDMPSKGHWPALAKRFPPIGHTDPPYAPCYPADYPDSPCSRWLYDTAVEEHNTMPAHMPSPMDLDPWPTLLTAQWLHDWEPYVNT
jgi:hypothetical protein